MEVYLFSSFIVISSLPKDRSLASKFSNSLYFHFFSSLLHMTVYMATYPSHLFANWDPKLVHSIRLLCVFYPFPILNERSEISSTAIYIMQWFHSSRWANMLSHLYPDLKGPGLPGCIEFNSVSELHISISKDGCVHFY